jgi:branched-chain amino acid transport system substrate-binding protein
VGRRAAIRRPSSRTVAFLVSAALVSVAPVSVALVSVALVPTAAAPAVSASAPGVPGQVHEARRAAAGAASAVGITRTGVTVAGIVGTDPTSIGADVGAQARFARANDGGGVRGRTVRYLRTESVSDSAAADAAAVRAATEAFAVVPAVGPAVGAAVLDGEGVPFFGAADTVDWYTTRTGFGFTGTAVTERTRAASSPIGVQLRTVMGGTDDTVSVLHSDDAAGAVRAAQVRRSLRGAGFRQVVVVPVPLEPGTFDVVTLGAEPASGAFVFLTTAARTSDLVDQLVAAGSTATLVVGPEFYVPGSPALTEGLTVLTPVAAFEEPTAANRRLAADVEAFAPGTPLTSAIAAGYWSADFFLRALDASGRELTRARLLDALNGEHFSFAVAGTVGRSTWPEMHTRPVPCGSLVQSDGTRYVLVAPYACAPTPPR